MEFADLIQILAIIIECAVVVVAVLIATQKKKVYGWFIALTFALFALFDVIRIIFADALSGIHAGLLFVACASMLYAVWLMWKNP
ncbi:hypothetical protein [Methanoregula sp. UBA64]|jgi:hypothetical protein|uniref:hypothetical protein n=1 Tax=Methanoregula sp. UBA64 TaxID=1915554 RepID=UPI0025E4AB0E|nr:hypothetical protein [Methanoregula sp. UBA64]